MSSIRVDFYLLNSEAKEAVAHIACRLIEKAYLRGHTVFIYCDTQDEAHQLDELLWTFKEESFIPHNLQGEGPEPPPPVQIGFTTEPRGFNDILLNLSPTIPAFAYRFNRIIEIVGNTEEAKETSREHYRQYRGKQLQLFTHQITYP